MSHIFWRLDLSIKTFHDIFPCDLCYQIDLYTIIQCLVVMLLLHVLYMATRICQKYNKLLRLWSCDGKTIFLVREKPPPPHCCTSCQGIFSAFDQRLLTCNQSSYHSRTYLLHNTTRAVVWFGPLYPHPTRLSAAATTGSDANSSRRLLFSLSIGFSLQPVVLGVQGCER